MAQQHAKAAQGPSDVGDVKVPKAAGADARTIAEIYAQKGALKEKPVTIRGKVVKFNPGIMNKNWSTSRTAPAGPTSRTTISPSPPRT